MCKVQQKIVQRKETGSGVPNQPYFIRRKVFLKKIDKLLTADGLAEGNSLEVTVTALSPANSAMSI